MKQEFPPFVVADIPPPVLAYINELEALCERWLQDYCALRAKYRILSTRSADGERG